MKQFIAKTVLLFICLLLLTDSFRKLGSIRKTQWKIYSIRNMGYNLTPRSPIDSISNLKNTAKLLSAIAVSLTLNTLISSADDSIESSTSSKPDSSNINWKAFKLPYEHENLEFGEFLGKATILFNMKIDDPQTVNQFPGLLEVYNKYKDQGLNVQGFPTEQGWFEPDDDETCREKSKVYYGFGDYPHASIFDKVMLYPFVT